MGRGVVGDAGQPAESLCVPHRVLPVALGAAVGQQLPVQAADDIPVSPVVSRASGLPGRHAHGRVEPRHVAEVGYEVPHVLGPGLLDGELLDVEVRPRRQHYVQHQGGEAGQRGAPRAHPGGPASQLAPGQAECQCQVRLAEGKDKKCLVSKYSRHDGYSCSMPRRRPGGRPGTRLEALLGVGRWQSTALAPRSSTGCVWSPAPAYASLRPRRGARRPGGPRGQSQQSHSQRPGLQLADTARLPAQCAAQCAAHTISLGRRWSI